MAGAHLFAQEGEFFVLDCGVWCKSGPIIRGGGRRHLEDRGFTPTYFGGRSRTKLDYEHSAFVSELACWVADARPSWDKPLVSWDELDGAVFYPVVYWRQHPATVSRFAPADVDGSLVWIRITNVALPGKSELDRLLGRGLPVPGTLSHIITNEWIEFGRNLESKGWAVSFGDQFAYGPVAISDLTLKSGPLPEDVREWIAERLTDG